MVDNFGDVSLPACRSTQKLLFGVLGLVETVGLRALNSNWLKYEHRNAEVACPASLARIAGVDTDLQ